MPVPKRHTTHSKKKMRSANKHLTIKNTSTCSNCQEAKMPHRVCMSCGYYGETKVLQKEDN